MKKRRVRIAKKKPRPRILIPPTWKNRRQSGEEPASGGHDAIAALAQSVRAARNGWLFLLSVLLFIIVTIASSSHADLLLNAKVKLPIVQVGVPVSLFFVMAPLLVLLVHADTLMRHFDLARKAHAASGLLPENVRGNLPGYHLLQILLGESRHGFARAAYHVFHWGALAAGPLLVLLFVQISYLPLHDPVWTSMHRYMTAADALLILLYVFALNNRWMRWAAGLMGGAAIVFSFLVATLPGGDIEKFICRNVPRQWCPPVPFGTIDRGELWDNNRHAFLPTAWLFEGDIDRATGRLNSWFSRNLVIINGGLGGKKGERLNLRSRDLRYAILDGANLAGADFTASNLTGARLSGANLRGAEFGCANTGKRVPGGRGGNKPAPKNTVICASWFLAHPAGSQSCANLTGAGLSRADLTGARIGDAMLREADLSEAILPGTEFTSSCLFTADLSGANLEKSKIKNADMVGARLIKTKLKGAIIENTDLSLANLTQADLRWARFSRSYFSRIDDAYVVIDGKETFTATLFAAQLQGADLRCADFSNVAFLAADLTGARIWQTVPPDSKKDFLFSSLYKISIDGGDIECGKSGEASFHEKVNDWWRQAAPRLRNAADGWLRYVIKAVCINGEYLIASPRRMNPEIFYSDLGGWTDFSYYDDFENRLLNDKRLSAVPAPPNSSKDAVLVPVGKVSSLRTGPFVNPENIWARIQNGTCPASNNLNGKQKQKLKAYAVLHKRRKKYGHRVIIKRR